jgi:hypothetical protein
MTHHGAISSQRPAQSQAKKTHAALADMAAGGLVERGRIDTVARVLVLARRAAALSGRGESLVDRMAARWDPSVMTAAEFAEMLTPAERDRLIAAAPGWAAAQLPGETRRAA